jgi:hypothetical protein
MQSSPTTGHVFEIGTTTGIFGVVSYYPDTVVSIAMFSDAPNVTQACERLGKRLAGRFIPADTVTARWGQTVFNAQGSAVLI